MILLCYWKFLPLFLLASLINGNEVSESETNLNRAVYLTLLQMLQNTIFNKHKEPIVESSSSSNTATSNDLLNNIKLSSITSLFSNTGDNSISNFLKLIKSVTVPHAVSNSPSLTSSTLVPTVFANGQIGMTPLGKSAMQYSTNINSATYSTLPIDQINTGSNAHPLPYSSFNNNLGSLFSDSIGTGPLTVSYGSFGNNIDHNLYKKYENGFGGDYKFDKYQAAASASQFNPHYSQPPFNFPQYGQPLWSFKGPTNLLYPHMSSDSNKFTRGTINFTRNSGKNFKIVKKPLTRFSLVLGFVFLLLVEQVSQSRNESLNPAERNVTATVGLVVHAAAGGVALGAVAVTSHTDVEIIVFLAIMLHKATAAYGLVTFLLYEGIERQRIRRHLLVFALAKKH
ncbi:hypothetical protein RN001_004776 [Aquatica leii]|uniref:Uncharacterized protein n=1 Tax=Aquatica leii TaxID=1421715 RepID=A0AAN7PB57_9COLE|nr:hypothetical protein RN001_004776 [Aquatica leii]